MLDTVNGCVPRPRGKTKARVLGGFRRRPEREWNLDRRAVRPVFTRLWDDPHRLELQLRARAAAIGRRGKESACCPVCRLEVNEGDGGMQLGSIAVHQDCLPAARSGAGASERAP
jgi:hypothetical protein